MKTKFPIRSNTAMPFLLSMLFAFGGQLITATPAGAQAFQPGEILVYGHTIAPPFPYSFNVPCIARYSSVGTLLGTYTVPGNADGSNIYAGLTPDGKVVASSDTTLHQSEIDIIDPINGSLSRAFDPHFDNDGRQMYFSAVSGPVSVFANGTIALSDPWRGLSLWGPAGSPITVAISPGRNTVGSDDILYVAQGASLARVNSSGNLLGYINLNFSASDLAMNPLDGTFWITNGTDNSVEHVTSNGTVLGGFATGLSSSFYGVGIDLAPDDNSLYVSAAGGTAVEHFDFNGNLLGSFNLANPNLAGVLIVVPNPAPAPEPTSAMLLFSGIALLAARRHRS